MEPKKLTLLCLVEFYNADLNSIESMFNEHIVEQSPFTGSINIDLACINFEMAQDIQTPQGTKA